MAFEAAVMMGFSIASFILIYFGIQLGKSANTFYKVSQILFLSFGLYMILLMLTVGRTIASDNSASAGIIDTMDVGIVIFTYLSLIFIVVAVINLIYNVLKGMLPKKRMEMPSV